MGVVTLEGIIDHGQIRLTSEVHLPENIEVYVVVPGIRVESVALIPNPRLAHPEQITDFEMEVVDQDLVSGEAPDDGI